MNKRAFRYQQSPDLQFNRFSYNLMQGLYWQNSSLLSQIRTVEVGFYFYKYSIVNSRKLISFPCVFDYWKKISTQFASKFDPCNMNDAMTSTFFWRQRQTRISICSWATEFDIGDSSSRAYPSSSHNPTRKISIRAEARGGRGERGLVEADRGKGGKGSGESGQREGGLKG